MQWFYKSVKWGSCDCHCSSCPTSSAGTECTKKVEEDGVCCCSERLSAENGSSCVVVVMELETLYAVSCK